ncbi:MAG: hypothetical protein FIA82_09135 [Melioribacter sp.]|nr:hypothetical protein [Melioribacter sp.]
MKNILIASLIYLSLGASIFAQSNDNLDQTLSNLSRDAVNAYISPAVSGFGSNLNSGWVSKLPSASKMSLYVDFKIIGMGSFFSNNKKDFLITGQVRFTDQQADEILANSGYYFPDPRYVVLKNEMLSKDWTVNISGPTVIGSKSEKAKIEFPGDQSLGIQSHTVTIDQVKGLLDNWKIFPSAALQLTVGTIAGTNLSIRYLPDISRTFGFNDQLGKFTFWGIGFIHNPGVWFMIPLPVDLGIGYFYQKLKVGNTVESTNSQFGLYVSKSFGFGISFAPYAGLTFESSKTKVTYEYNYDTSTGPSTLKINLDLEGENSAALLFGCNVKLSSVVNVNADFKVAKTKTISAGISFVF